jgi:NDP-mannose synthase
MRAVILAGGKGTRLAPYTTVLPKPLMPVGDMPILELLIRQLERAGIDRVTLAVGHLSSLLMAYFQEGASLGVAIDYSVEREPLGTAGPLGLVDGLDETFLVMNGDLLTDLDFQAMIDAHRRHGVLATIGIYERTVKIDLGVVEATPDHMITGYIEKPTNRFLVSMGVYVLEPAVLSRVPHAERFDLPDLVRRLLTDGEAVAGYLHPGYWLDIGRPDDFQRAQEDAVEIQRLLLDDPSIG